MKKRSYELPDRLDETERRNTGAFYTPPEIVDFMVELLLKDREIHGLKICDFSCGAGAFLAGVLRYVRNNAPDEYDMCRKNLWGIDINPEALVLARRELPDIPENHFLCADTLALTPASLPAFDIIIGNPPYRCSGVKYNSGFSPERLKALKAAFPNSFEYKMNLFALFIEKAAALAGETALIVPDSLLCGRYFSKLRRFLTENFFIKGIFLLEKPAFDAAPGNGVILHFLKGRAPGAAALRTAHFPPGHISVAHKDFHLLDQRRFTAEKRCRFQLTFSADGEKILRKLLKDPDTVQDHFHFASGLISKRGKSTIVSSVQEEGCVPGIVFGREIRPFEISSEGFYLKIDPENIKSGLDHERFASEKIFLRQTGSSLIAAVSREKLYALNNCHIGTRKSDFPLDTLAALLNSTVMNFLYRYLSGEHNRNFAQIDIDILNTLPLRRTPDFDRFAARCAAEKALRADLDAQCAGLFGLTEDELTVIRECMK